MEEYVRKTPSDKDRKMFFSGQKKHRNTLYKPGVYRYRSFEEARADDMARMIKK